MKFLSSVSFPIETKNKPEGAHSGKQHRLANISTDTLLVNFKCKFYSTNFFIHVPSHVTVFLSHTPNPLPSSVHVTYVGCVGMNPWLHIRVHVVPKTSSSLGQPFLIPFSG